MSNRVHQLVAFGLAGTLAGAAACSDLSFPSAPGAPAAGSPFAEARLYVDPSSKAAAQAAAWRASRPADAAAMDVIAAQPIAAWMTSSTPDVRAAAADVVARAHSAGAIPVFAVYNIPRRDCSSAGGSAAEYAAWIRRFAEGLSARSVVVLEPDALAQAGCLALAERQARYASIADAVQVLKGVGAVVYVDAGNARWLAADEIASRLTAAGIAHADGFALNVANYIDNATSIAFGEAVSRAVGGKHFIIDTGRNGRGGAGGDWCNVPGQALGANPTAATGHPLVDAFVWVKPPGESDGTCNGGPAAGTWWAEYALALVRNR